MVDFFLWITCLFLLPCCNCIHTLVKYVYGYIPCASVLQSCVPFSFFNILSSECALIFSRRAVQVVYGRTHVNQTTHTSRVTLFTSSMFFKCVNTGVKFVWCVSVWSKCTCRPCFCCFIRLFYTNVLCLPGYP